MLSVIVVAFAFVVSFCGCYWIVTRGKKFLLDHPNNRSLHKVPVPRLGGVAIVAGVVCSVIAYSVLLSETPSVYACVAVVALLLAALWDDKKNLPPLVRLSVQCVAALLLVWGEKLYVDMKWLPVLSPVFGILALMWCINLYNFMDGMDGFAGSMGAIGFAALACLGAIQGQMEYSTSCAVIAAACLGFLCFNFPPARIFMGDSGSTLLGLAMGALSVQGWKMNLFSLWVPAVIFSPFWVDATITLLRRLYRGEKVWRAHRQHYYQRWVLVGYSHRRVVSINIGLMLLCATTVVVAQACDFYWDSFGLPLAWFVCYGSIAYWSEQKLRTVEKVAEQRC